MTNGLSGPHNSAVINAESTSGGVVIYSDNAGDGRLACVTGNGSVNTYPPGAANGHRNGNCPGSYLIMTW